MRRGKRVDAAESVIYEEHIGEYRICTDEQKAIPILIANNEKFGNEYSLLLDAPEWASLNTDTAKLDAEKQGVVLIDYNTDGILGDFVINLNAISSLGKVQRKASLNMSVEKCHDLELRVGEQDAICSGEITEHPTIIRNKGTIAQEVQLGIAGAEWMDFGNNTQLTLNPGEEQTVTLIMQPEESISGTFEGKIGAIPDNKTQFASYLPIQMEVIEKLSCYEADISARSLIRNTYEEDVFFAKVKNKGIKKADYAITLDGPSWASITPQNLELNPGKSGNLNIRINPQDAEPGTYGLKILLESNEASYSKDIKIRLREKTGVGKWIESAAQKYRYYFYVLAAIIALALIFMKQISNIRDSMKESCRKRQVRKQRIINLRLAREKRQAEKKVLEKKERKESRKTTNFLKNNLKKNAILAVLIIAIALALAGQILGLYNLKYTPIYIKNIVVGYLYYILMGIGIVALMFAAVLLYNRLRKKSKKKPEQKTIKESKKSEKRSGKGRWHTKPGRALAVFIPIIAIIAALAYFNFFDDIMEFIVLYSYYFILGIILLIIIILALTFYRPLAKFFRK